MRHGVQRSGKDEERGSEEREPREDGKRDMTIGESFWYTCEEEDEKAKMKRRRKADAAAYSTFQCA